MDVQAIRKEFPILHRLVNDQALIYFDNAASSQKPKAVIEDISKYYSKYNANVHRGIHTLSQEATYAMEASRKSIQNFINAADSEEIIFTSGTTEGINLLANSFTTMFEKGDEIIISTLEHHSNIVPWQMLCERTGAQLKVIPIKEDQSLDMEAYLNLLSPRTKLVSVNHISNALGVVNPIQEIITQAHEYNAWVMIDAAQSAPHSKMDVQKWDADFVVFSGHKMYAPTGVGVLYGKKAILNNMPPFLGGGEMIERVTFEKTTYAGLPFKFEAGTPNISGNIVMETAIEFMQSIGIEQIEEHEAQLLAYCQKQLEEIEEVEIYAREVQKAGAISFNLKNAEVHPSDVGFILDKQGIAVRTGHHCAQPLMDSLGIKGTVRASFAVYNTMEEIDSFIVALKKTIGILG